MTPTLALAALHALQCQAAISASIAPPFSLNLVQDLADLTRYEFMRTAFLAGGVEAVVSGMVGYFVVLRRLTFAGDALAHVAFAGALAAAVLGLPPLVGLLGLTLLAAVGIGALGERARARDVAVGTVLAWVLGVGVLFLSLYSAHASAGNASAGINVLFGSIFGIQPDAARVAVLLGAGCLLVLLAIARPLLFASLDPLVAAVRGVPVRWLGVVFLLVLGLTVAEAVQAVGSLLVFALLVTPAAIALRLTARPYRALALAGALALLFTWLGLVIAFYQPIPASFAISALAFISYVALLLWQRRPAAATPLLQRARAALRPR